MSRNSVRKEGDASFSRESRKARLGTSGAASVVGDESVRGRACTILFHAETHRTQPKRAADRALAEVSRDVAR